MFRTLIMTIVWALLCGCDRAPSPPPRVAVPHYILSRSYGSWALDAKNRESMPEREKINIPVSLIRMGNGQVRVYPSDKNRAPFTLDASGYSILPLNRLYFNYFVLQDDEGRVKVCPLATTEPCYPMSGILPKLLYVEGRGPGLLLLDESGTFWESDEKGNVSQAGTIPIGNAGTIRKVIQTGRLSMMVQYTAGSVATVNVSDLSRGPQVEDKYTVDGSLLDMDLNGKGELFVLTGDKTLVYFKDEPAMPSARIAVPQDASKVRSAGNIAAVVGEQTVTLYDMSEGVLPCVQITYASPVHDVSLDLRESAGTLYVSALVGEDQESFHAYPLMNGQLRCMERFDPKAGTYVSLGGAEFVLSKNRDGTPRGVWMMTNYDRLSAEFRSIDPKTLDLRGESVKNGSFQSAPQSPLLFSSDGIIATENGRQMHSLDYGTKDLRLWDGSSPTFRVLAVSPRGVFLAVWENNRFALHVAKPETGEVPDAPFVYYNTSNLMQKVLFLGYDQLLSLDVMGIVQVWQQTTKAPMFSLNTSSPARDVTIDVSEDGKRFFIFNNVTKMLDVRNAETYAMELSLRLNISRPTHIALFGDLIVVDRSYLYDRKGNVLFQYSLPFYLSSEFFACFGDHRDSIALCRPKITQSVTETGPWTPLP